MHNTLQVSLDEHYFREETVKALTRKHLGGFLSAGVCGLAGEFLTSGFGGMTRGSLTSGSCGMARGFLSAAVCRLAGDILTSGFGGIRSYHQSQKTKSLWPDRPPKPAVRTHVYNN